MERMKPIVSVLCQVFNHEHYLRDCLNGIVCQITTFPFEIIVHDDASTDGSVQIIKEYAEKYQEIVKPIFEPENLYSKQHEKLERILVESCNCKYVALCEGDDFWSDPYKLQKQYDFMEAHQTHSLCFCSHNNLYPDGSLIEVARYDENIEACPIRDVICGGGGYMATNSMFYRKEMYVPYYIWAGDCPIGDYPMVLSLVSKGNVGFLRDCMCVYRRNAIGSWSERNTKKSSKELARMHWKVVRMLYRYNIWTKFKYFRWVNRVIKKDLILILKELSLPLRIKLGLSKIKSNYELQ